MDEAAERRRPEEALRATLDRHGYGFHYAVVRHVAERGVARQISWEIRLAADSPAERARMMAELLPIGKPKVRREN